MEESMAQNQAVTTAPGAPAALRPHLALAAEARRRGDHAAAGTHENDALVALRAALAAARTEARA
jgi:hypothetical protein